MVAKAVLELVIVDNGSSPVGQPAPPGVRGETFQQAATAGATASSVGETIGDAVKAAGVAGLAAAAVPAASALNDLANVVKKAADVEGKAVDLIANKMNALAIRGGGGGTVGRGGSVIPIEGGNELIVPPIGVGRGAAAMVEETAGAGAGMSFIAAASAVAAFAAAAIVAGKAVGKVSDWMQHEAESLARFSPELSTVNATNDIRQMFAEMRRAQRVGPELAAYEDRMGKLSSDFYDLKTELLKGLTNIYKIADPFVDLADKAVGALTDGAKTLNRVGEVVTDGFSVVTNLMTGHFPTAQKRLEELEKHAKGIFDKTEDKPDPLVDPFAKELGDMARPPMRRVNGHMVPLGI